ncbi:cobalt ABC transporter, permease protein CbiQ [Rubidibacter lacunae KORDI 51-2]|uniref:Cobalt ABC transporter, permease protein CbiQ n=1 Tax=Rubidibacter lacunae KORDI 51-2 TaxID=582515 RepID=U5DG60_9CHRO|nr:cobalt ECF transporter T component CbiQ [Rubidibacter lacunae]ERN40252.1 cobalt ABC transporter, permease protein CbiQ [Rubidibacter lacunae KORDI 51-2]
MKLALDRYAYLCSPIHRWEQRSKLLALLSLIFAFACVRHLLLLPAMVVVTAGLYWASRLPVRYLLRRLRYPGLFIAAAVALLPFAGGETAIAQWGPLTVWLEGCKALVLIAVRFACILTISLILFGTAPFATSIKAMRALGLPATIVDMMLLTYRYLDSLGDTRLRMQRAMQLRGFQTHGWNCRTLAMLASLAGSLLVRSYEQSQRVYYAMRLRGYGNPHSRLSVPFGGDASGRLACGIVLALATVFVAAELLLQVGAVS